VPARQRIGRYRKRRRRTGSLGCNPIAQLATTTAITIDGVDDYLYRAAHGNRRSQSDARPVRARARAYSVTPAAPTTQDPVKRTDHRVIPSVDHSDAPVLVVTVTARSRSLKYPVSFKLKNTSNATGSSRRSVHGLSAAGDRTTEHTRQLSHTHGVPTPPRTQATHVSIHHSPLQHTATAAAPPSQTRGRHSHASKGWCHQTPQDLPPRTQHQLRVRTAQLAVVPTQACAYPRPGRVAEPCAHELLQVRQHLINAGVSDGRGRGRH
jgi:hypothetical protein